MRSYAITTDLSEVGAGVPYPTREFDMLMTILAFAQFFVASDLSATAPPGGDRGTCVGRELSRTRLVVDGGRELYIEPKVLEASGARVLLAGKPSYIFSRREPGTTADVESRHTVFGAMIEADGSARIVPAPPVNDGKVAAVAGIAAGTGAWRVIFAELDSVAVDSPQNIDQFWHGVYDGRQWSSLERLPRTPETPLLYHNSANLTQHGDTVVWAALAQVNPHRQIVIVFERHHGAWSHKIVATPFAHEVEAVHTRSLGFALAITHHDSVANGQAAKFLYTRESGWRQQAQIASVDTEGAPIPSEGPGDSSVTFEDNRATVRFSPMAGVLGNREEPFVIVGRMLGTGFAVITLGDGRLLWATQFLGPNGENQLQLARPIQKATEIIWQTPYPYRGGFAATGYSQSDVLIVGPELSEAEGLLVSLIVRIRVACDSSSNPGG